MSDVQDLPQDSFDGSLKESMDHSADKKIVFGARRPTEDAVGLNDMPLLIGAPFPSERTLHWNPCSPGQDIKVNDAIASGDDSSDDEFMPPQDDLGGVDVAFASFEKSASAVGLPPEFADHIAVVVSQEVLLKVNEHVSQSLDRELGGFLLGNRYRCPNTHSDYVIIDQYSPAKFTESTEINLSFTHEAWAQLSDELSGKFLGKLLIGWYHSHPRMDVFLSSHDMEIQTERFPEPWMVALVLEPEKHRGGFFGARDGRVNPNSPVDFFELLERNSRDSVLAWENYSAVDPATRSAPLMSATNTASLGGTPPQEILVARAQQSKKVPVRQRVRKRFLTTMVVVLLLAAVAAGVVNRQRLKAWWQKKTSAATGNPLPSPATPQQETGSQQQPPATQPQTPATQQPAPAPPKPKGAQRRLVSSTPKDKDSAGQRAAKKRGVPERTRKETNTRPR